MHSKYEKQHTHQTDYTQHTTTIGLSDEITFWMKTVFGKSWENKSLKYLERKR